MQIAICDDEKNIRELIGEKVLKHYPGTDEDIDKWLEKVKEKKEEQKKLE